MAHFWWILLGIVIMGVIDVMEGYKMSLLWWIVLGLAVLAVLAVVVVVVRVRRNRERVELERARAALEWEWKMRAATMVHSDLSSGAPSSTASSPIQSR